MKTAIDNIELDITKEIINIGFSKGADSLSYFTKEKVFVRLFSLEINSNQFYPISKIQEGGRCFILSTDIKGEIEGKSFLILDEKEVSKIIEKNFPDTQNKRSEMVEALMLEIDNIVTAAVVTQFANILKKKMFGDVPRLMIVERDQVNPILDQVLSNIPSVLYLNSRFISGESTIDSEFIWFVDDKFLELVKGLMSDERKMQIMKGLSKGL